MTRGRAYLFAATFGVWVLVTASLEWQELVLGAVVALIAVLAVGDIASFFGGIRGVPALLLGVPVYTVRFIWRLILANIDVARRVLSPRVPVQPGIVAVKTKIRSDIGRLLLANSITLTPGTLTLDSVAVGNTSNGAAPSGESVLYVHWIDTPKEGDVDAEIAGTFESGLERIVE